MLVIDLLPVSRTNSLEQNCIEIIVSTTTIQPLQAPAATGKKCFRHADKRKPIAKVVQILTRQAEARKKF